MRLQQQLGAAQAELAKVKDKLQALRAGGNMGTASEDGGMPSFTPNNQKAKPFLKRLEYGFNLQTGNKRAYDFPASNDLALTLGYRLNDRLVGGIGIAYKFGLGKDWKNISFTHEGIGIRSYIDWKLSAPQKGLKVLFGNLWLTGGYEKNYMSRFRYAAALSQVAWQTSGLLGVSKKIQYKKKELKVSVLWDFLRQRTADGQPFVFRYGYNF